ncbi:MAG: glycerol-3-phosphate acyltransferase, partial [Candidatus Pacebacteria bacterium]|nr:glycerol-3-phosphate acyltransferase [Candidatus Paceibacterota bacterium]
MIFQLILAVFIAYLIGSIPFSLVFVKLVIKKDLRESGSKNAGALNTFRIISKEKGMLPGILSFLLVGVLDAGKGVIALLIAKALVAPYSLACPDCNTITVVYAVLLTAF